VLEVLLDFVLQVVARFVGVTVIALAVWCMSGFRTSYFGEWRRLFDKHSGVYSWIDVLGLAVIVAGFAALALSIYFGITILHG